MPGEGGGLQPLAGPLLAVHLAADPWSLLVVSALDPGLSPHNPNASFYPAKPRVSHWLSLIGPTLLGTAERFQLCTGLWDFAATDWAFSQSSQSRSSTRNTRVYCCVIWLMSACSGRADGTALTDQIVAIVYQETHVHSIMMLNCLHWMGVPRLASPTSHLSYSTRCSS